MIATARSIPSTTASGAPVRYEVCSAENLHNIPEIAPESVDLITAATAAHWFDMPQFWASASRVLRPGGTVILWTGGSFFCNPFTTPNAARVQQVLFELEVEILGPYELPGNRACRELYANLPLPWTVTGEEAQTFKDELSVFDESKFVRIEFNKDGHLEPGEHYLRGRKDTFLELKKGFSTASMVTRWRDANKEALEKGEVEDCIDYMTRKVRETIDEGLPQEEKGKRDWMDGGSAIVVLGFRKRE